VVLVFFGGSKNNVDISDSDDDNLNTSHGSSGVAGPKKKKTLLRPNHRTLAALAQEASTASAIGFSKTWPTNTATVLVRSYPNWPWMQPHQL
jgi:hypothetical protein